jgi:hypothetical protein
VPNDLATAIIPAAAGVFGGLVTAYATRGVERLRLRTSITDRANERLLEAVLTMNTAARRWLVQLDLWAHERQSPTYQKLTYQEQRDRFKEILPTLTAM